MCALEIFLGSGVVWCGVVWFGIQVGIVTWVATKLIQEYWFPPSRVTTETLIQDYVLPSSLSRLERLSLSNESYSNGEAGTGSTPQQHEQELGIHFLQYDNPGVEEQQEQQQQQRQVDYDGAAAGQPPPPRLSFQAMYLNHGFGASSLSWLPVLPKLVRRLGVQVGLGHDAVGFGFTERPKQQERQSSLSSSSLPSPSSLYYYSPPGSATIGLALLKQKITLTPAADVAATTSTIIDPATHAKQQTTPRPIILMGHSLGSIATLHMALRLPLDVPKLVILVAPALGLRGGSPKIQQQQRQGIENPPDGAVVTALTPPRKSDLSQNPRMNGVRLGPIWALATRLLCQVAVIVARVSAVTGHLLSRILLDPVIVYILRRVVG
jgi:pimeloyl-ACP methyl ester carboxylesterase